MALFQMPWRFLDYITAVVIVLIDYLLALRITALKPFLPDLNMTTMCGEDGACIKRDCQMRDFISCNKERKNCCLRFHSLSRKILMLFLWIFDIIVQINRLMSRNKIIL